MAHALYICDARDFGVPLHPCRRAHNALLDAGIEHETVVFDRNRPGGLFTKGKRPELKRLTGYETLPVLVLDDGTAIAPSGKIVAWAQANAQP